VEAEYIILYANNAITLSEEITFTNIVKIDLVLTKNVAKLVNIQIYKKKVSCVNRMFVSYIKDKC
jgi:hypothetical protein